MLRSGEKLAGGLETRLDTLPIRVTRDSTWTWVPPLGTWDSTWVPALRTWLDLDLSGWGTWDLTRLDTLPIRVTRDSTRTRDPMTWDLDLTRRLGDLTTTLTRAVSFTNSVASRLPDIQRDNEHYLSSSLFLTLICPGLAFVHSRLRWWKRWWFWIWSDETGVAYRQTQWLMKHKTFSSLIGNVAHMYNHVHITIRCR